MPGIRSVAPAAGTMRVGSGCLRPVEHAARAPAAAAALRQRHGHEGRAVALEAAHVEVAAGLVDGGLAAELGVDRLQAQAVRLDAAVAAALADPLVDHDLEAGPGQQAPLAVAPLLGRALLVVDEHGDARDGPQVLLRLDDVVAVASPSRPWAATMPRYLPGSSVVMMTSFTPSLSSLDATAGTGSRPVASWPPVMATAPL